MAKDLGSGRPRIDKLGVKPGAKVSIVGGIEDPSFLDELAARGAGVSRRSRKDADLVFFPVTRAAELGRLARLREAIKKDGAIWVLWAKGRKELREDDVRKAALAQGLVDVKVASFSDTLSALKLVIPLAQRR